MAIRYAFFTSIRTTVSALILTLILLPSTGFSLPLEFSASYDLKKYGVTLAKSVYSLKHENNGIRITQHTEPVGLAAMLRNDELDENSFLSIQNGQLLLTEFSYRQTSDDEKNRDIQIKIDWIQSSEKLLGKVNGTAYGEELDLKIDEPVWDTSSYMIPLMTNTSENTPLQKYTMMVKGRFQTYSFITHGVDEIEVNGNIMQTIKVERDDSSNKHPIYLWLAPSLNNLPVKIEKWEDGKRQLTMSLNNAQFLSDKTMNFKKAIDNTEEFDDL
ncbi:MAG: DUF3108 domain-containing protein [Gammaproteobacteria bacterium]|nr:DUF3108 domain-containing protein [Gammaproteobacteria bacterium]